MNFAGFVRRFIALVRKETRQMLRDRSNLAVGLVLPVGLVLLFGYGLSFDVKHAPVAVVMDDSSPTARAVTQGLDGSRYLAPVRVASMADAERLMRAGEVDAIVRVPVDFSRRLVLGDARVQLLLDGADSTTASTVLGYARATRRSVIAARSLPAGGVATWSK